MPILLLGESIENAVVQLVRLFAVSQRFESVHTDGTRKDLASVGRVDSEWVDCSPSKENPTELRMNPFHDVVLLGKCLLVFDKDHQRRLT